MGGRRSRPLESVGNIHWKEKHVYIAPPQPLQSYDLQPEKADKWLKIKINRAPELLERVNKMDIQWYAENNTQQQ